MLSRDLVSMHVNSTGSSFYDNIIIILYLPPHVGYLILLGLHKSLFIFPLL